MSLHYIEREPLSGPPESAPTLVLLHGVRSNEHDLMSLAPDFDERFRVISVRAPLVLGPGAYGWYNVGFVQGGFLIDEEEAKQGFQEVLKFIDGLPQPLYLMGFSQGCIMSVATALTVPEKVAGVVGIAGRLLDPLLVNSASPERIKGLPAMVVHGTFDTVIPVSSGREIRDRLQSLSADLTYREYEMGHHLTPQSIADIRTWLSGRLASPDWRNGIG